VLVPVQDLDILASIIVSFGIVSHVVHVVVCTVDHFVGGRRGRDRMVVEFTTTCTISAYHHSSCEFESRS